MAESIFEAVKQSVTVREAAQMYGIEVNRSGNSSVSHCGLVLFAILMMNTTAGTGAILQMLSHGLMTALFFALIGMIYGRTHTRDVRELSGLMKVMPFLDEDHTLPRHALL